MSQSKRLSVAVLVDLLRSEEAGGHVKCWERLGKAAALNELPLDLTVYFSGPKQEYILGEYTRFRQLPPLLSTALLKFLPYVPDHTDLSPYHPSLARELQHYDLLHTTDGFFAFAKTAARVSQSKNIPLVTSTHTDTPSYTRIFTRNMLERFLAGAPALRRKCLEDWQWPERQERAMQNKLKEHIELCRYALVTRQEDHTMAEAILGKERVCHLRLGVDKILFNPDRADRLGIEGEHKIPHGRIIMLFVGRIDIGKNIYTLAQAMANLIQEGLPMHLIMAGKGPASEAVQKILAGHITAPGYVKPNELARLYASVDGLALSSEVEIRSMAGVEAMASDCPALVSEKSGVAQLFNNTPAMLVVNGGVAGWTDALRHFANSPDTRVKMRRAASDYSRTQLASWSDILKEDIFSVWNKAVSSQISKAA